MHKAPTAVQHTQPAASPFFTRARGFAGTAGGAPGSGRGQGFGPRPARGARLPDAPAAAGRRRAAAAAARDPRAQAGQQPTLVTQQQPGDGGEGGGGGQGTEQAPVDGAMHGQQMYKAGGLPSSRSDTMLLQTAEQQSQRYGLPPTGSRGPASAGSSPAVGGAPGVGLGVRGSPAPAANSIPVYVMLPLDTVRGSAASAALPSAGCFPGVSAGLGAAAAAARRHAGAVARAAACVCACSAAARVLAGRKAGPRCRPLGVFPPRPAAGQR